MAEQLLALLQLLTASQQVRVSVMARSGWLQHLRDNGEGAKTEWGVPVSKVAGKAKRRLEGREERIDEKGCPRPH